MSDAAEGPASGLSIPIPEDEESKASRKYDLSNTGELVRLIRDEDESVVKEEVQQHVVALFEKYDLGNYKPLILFDEIDSISRFHSNNIYNAASSCVDSGANILLILHSAGGSIEPAYLISKMCKRLSKEKFIVTVPRKAKSAATLIALGADEIHMGLMSELGPIDPQIDGYPALSLSNALDRVADLASRFPDSSSMFAAYLEKTLELNDLGYFDRVSESAAQYAERLLEGKSFAKGQTPATLANHFVNHYKDHNFVIDMDESEQLLGFETIKKETTAYDFSNEVYKFLDLLKVILDIFGSKKFEYVGSLDKGFMIRAKENRSSRD